ncbi:MAG: glycoside hydrolase family 3 C-terminal domain-containing protein, partial [Spirochaetaceae bacterium]|nr:glycoside hydrolase family 3 C-terminal domain-containing protein [Spirochaetaceae bacterium]
QSIGLASAFDPELLRRIARAIGMEARAKHAEFARLGDRGPYKGLTFWSPNINIFRDPRWGRGQETYGEDPYLTSRLGVAFVRGLQGEDPERLIAAACAKHFAAHSGPEVGRHSFDARVSDRDLRETYLPAFEALVREARVESVMGSYNRVNGVPACANARLLGRILRGEWGFEGHVVSDCEAICDIWKGHEWVATPEEAAAEALKAGCDLSCGNAYEALLSAVEKGLLVESDLTLAAERLLLTRFRLGMLDGDGDSAAASLPMDIVCSVEHRELAYRAALESVVLLKNDGILPLPSVAHRIAVIGPNARSYEALVANYCGTAASYVTVLDGMRTAAQERCAEILYAEGCHLTKTDDHPLSEWGAGARGRFTEAKSAALRSDVVVFAAGLDSRIEGEEGDAGEGDRRGLRLPGVQEELILELAALGKPIVLVLLNGGPLILSRIAPCCSAILEAWYPGQEGGRAIADLLFGRESPSGRLPVSFPGCTEDLPPFEDYSMEGRTYRFAAREAAWPFGFGLSYARFGYASLELSSHAIRSGESVRASVTVANLSTSTADEIAQLYLKDLAASGRVPRWKLVAFRRLRLEPGRDIRIDFEIEPQAMALVREDGSMIVEPGAFRLFAGGRQPDKRSASLTGGSPVLRADFTVEGEEQTVKPPLPC